MGGAESISCPLCHTHLDNQEMSYQCPEIKKEIEIKGNFSDIYNEIIQNETIETIVRISRYRTKVLENPTKLPTEVGPCVTPCDVLLETTQCPTWLVSWIGIKYIYNYKNKNKNNNLTNINYYDNIRTFY